MNSYNNSDNYMPMRGLDFGRQDGEVVRVIASLSGDTG